MIREIVNGLFCTALCAAFVWCNGCAHPATNAQIRMGMREAFPDDPTGTWNIVEVMDHTDGTDPHVCVRVRQDPSVRGGYPEYLLTFVDGRLHDAYVPCVECAPGQKWDVLFTD